MLSRCCNLFGCSSSEQPYQRNYSLGRLTRLSASVGGLSPFRQSNTPSSAFDTQETAPLCRLRPPIIFSRPRFCNLPWRKAICNHGKRPYQNLQGTCSRRFLRATLYFFTPMSNSATRCNPSAYFRQVSKSYDDKPSQMGLRCYVYVYKALQSVAASVIAHPTLRPLSLSVFRSHVLSSPSRQDHPKQHNERNQLSLSLPTLPAASRASLPYIPLTRTLHG